MKRCVVNFAKDLWYPMGQARLFQSLIATGFTGETFLFNSESILGSPSHHECPYAFKPHALDAARRYGYDIALWADASVWAIRDTRPLFDWIEQAGHAFFYNTICGPWCSDACLKTFGVTRDEAFGIPMLVGMCMGFDLRNPTTLEFLDRWLAAARDGVTFPGSWSNNGGEVSSDPRVKGHRHDQSAASLIAHQLGMPLLYAPTFFQYYENPTKTAYAENQDLSLIGQSVVLVAQGM